jgi:hypothetical protein
MKDFFITYNRVDQLWAKWIAWQLVEAKYDIVLDVWDFYPGSNFILEMDRATKETRCVIAVLSPDYLAALYTRPEWAAALADDPDGKRNKLVPVRVRHCKPEGLLGNIIHIDLVGLDEDSAINALLKGVNNKSLRPDSAPSFPLGIQHTIPEAPLFPTKLDMYREAFKSAFHNIPSCSDGKDQMNIEQNLYKKGAQEYKKKLEERHGTMRIIGMNTPVSLRNIYTRVNILEKITSRQRATIDQLEKDFDQDRRGFGVKKDTKSGTQIVNKLSKFILLGKPGAGKTTFLKHTVLEAVDGILEKRQIPILVGLKDLSDSGLNLIEYIAKDFETYHLPHVRLLVESLLEEGECMLLLDGLDEVTKHNEEEIINKIRAFSDRYYKNQYILSCRIAAYNYYFEKFTDVELADFDDNQIEAFIRNWFAEDMLKATQCWIDLNSNKPIKELANIPLLLTLLCITFEESLGFPANRAELYEDALDALLKRWDTSRNIKREEIYRYLPNKRKVSLLSRIASITFEKEQYFIRQTTLETYIAFYIQNFPEVKEQTLYLDSEVIIKAIEAHHGIFIERARGIYSFSHLTFQEYFAARYIVDNAGDRTLRKLVKDHFNQRRWREVFLLTAGMLEEADELVLLMEQELKEMGKHTIGQCLKEVQERIIRPDSSYSRSVSIALAFHYSFLVSPEGEIFERAKKATLDFIRSLDASIARDVINEPETVFDCAIYTDRIDVTNRQMAFCAGKGSAVTSYFESAQLLIDCINSKIYVSKSLRHRITQEILGI